MIFHFEAEMLALKQTKCKILYLFCLVYYNFLSISLFSLKPHAVSFLTAVPVQISEAKFHYYFKFSVQVGEPRGPGGQVHAEDPGKLSGRALSKIGQKEDDPEG